MPPASFLLLHRRHFRITVKDMEILYYTLIGISLYFASDWLLDRIESMYGKRLEYRSVVFFVIIMILALVTSQLINVFSQHAG